MKSAHRRFVRMFGVEVELVFCPQNACSGFGYSRLRKGKRTGILGMQIPDFCTQPYLVKPRNSPFTTLNAPCCQYDSLPLVSKLKLTSPRYLSYLDAFTSIIIPYINPACRINIVYLLKLGWRPVIIIK